MVKNGTLNPNFKVGGIFMIVDVRAPEGNIYAVMANASQIINDKGISKEMVKRVTQTAHSYNEALDIIGEYVKLEVINND